jgi:hypothetical protein
MLAIHQRLSHPEASMAHRIAPRHAGGFTRLALSGLLAGCTQWQVQSVPPQQLVATQHPGRIRVTRPDSTKLVLTDPEIVGDTLYGIEAGKGGASAHREGIPLPDVAHVSVRKNDPLATGVLIGVPAAALVGAALIIHAYAASID